MHEKTIRRTVAVALAILMALAGAPVDAALPHVVASRDVSKALEQAAAQRSTHIQMIEHALQSPEAAREAKRYGVSIETVAAAVPRLTDEELADLARRSSNVGDVVAGHSRRHRDGGLAIVGLVLLLAGIAILAAVGDWDEYYDEYDDCYCY